MGKGMCERPRQPFSWLMSLLLGRRGRCSRQQQTGGAIMRDTSPPPPVSSRKQRYVANGHSGEDKVP